MTGEWAPREPLLIQPDIAKEVAEAEDLFQCAAAAHFLLAKEILEQNPGDEAAKEQGTLQLQQHVRFREIASQKGDAKLAEIRARLAAQSDAKATAEAAIHENETATPEKPKTITETYLAHTLSFYSALADERYTAERTKHMPSDAISQNNWATANAQMAEFAFAQGDTDQASKYYNRIENPVLQWGLVAKVHATNPLLAKDWERPLAEKIEKNDFDAQTTLAMYKAGIAMRLNQLQTIKNDTPEYATLQNEIRSVWIDAKQLLEREMEQATMAPWDNLYQKPVPPGYDVREHLVAFAELLYDKGQMHIAREVTDVLKSINGAAVVYEEKGDPDARVAADAFLATTELRERCYGLNWDEVQAHAKDWFRDKTLSNETRSICAAIIETQDPNLFDRWALRYVPRVSHNKKQAVAAYLETTYGVTFTIPFTNGNNGYETHANLPRLVQPTTKANTASQEYYEVLAEAAVADRANAPSRRVSMFERFQAALAATKAAQQSEMSEAAQTAHTLESITAITAAYTEQRRDAATDKLPDLQLETVLQLDPYIKVAPGLAELDEKRYSALLDVLETIAPNGSETTNQLYTLVKEHCEFQLRALRAIPDEAVTAPRAERLKALQARVTKK